MLAYLSVKLRIFAVFNFTLLAFIYYVCPREESHKISAGNFLKPLGFSISSTETFPVSDPSRVRFQSTNQNLPGKSESFWFVPPRGIEPLFGD